MWVKCFRNFIGEIMYKIIDILMNCDGNTREEVY